MNKENEIKLVDLTLKELAINFKYISIWKDNTKKLLVEYQIRRENGFSHTLRKPLSECVFIKRDLSSCDIASLKISRILELTKGREDKILDKTFSFDGHSVRLYINLNGRR